MQLTVLEPVYGGAFRVSDGSLVRGVLPGESLAAPVDFALPLGRSLDRIEPGCLHFGACGGCHYQQADARTQLGWKEAILRALLLAAALPALPAIRTHAGEPWGYRTRIRLRVAREEAGVLRVGYSRPGSNTFLPIRMCPIAAPLLVRAALELCTLAAAQPAMARWLDAVAELELQTDAAESGLQARLLVRDTERARTGAAVFERLCAAWRLAVPELAGAGAQPMAGSSRRERRAWAGFAWGRPGLPIAVGAENYWVSRGAFFQNNRSLLPRLVELVLEHAEVPSGPNHLAWDLFAGVGLFTRVLAVRGWQVVAVEGAPVAAADLAAAAGTRPPRWQAVHSSALSFLQRQRTARERPELVVVDPPRAGLEGAAEALAAIRAARIVYVSCDPVTLARDLGVLVRAGYRVEAVELVDLFPQTFHMECVVRLVRTG